MNVILKMPSVLQLPSPDTIDVLKRSKQFRIMGAEGCCVLFCGNNVFPGGESPDCSGGNEIKAEWMSILAGAKRNWI